MKYELIDKYTIKQIKNCTRNMIIDGKTYPNIETSNPTDEILDELNIGMYLDEIASIPIYDSSTHYLQVCYSISDGKIIKGYEVLEIVPSEIDILKNDITELKTESNSSLLAITEVYEMILGG